MLLYSLLRQVTKNGSPLFFYSGYLEGVNSGAALVQQSVKYYEVLAEKRNPAELNDYDVLWVCPVALLSSILSERVRDVSFGSAKKTTATSVMAYIGGFCFGLQSAFVSEINATTVNVFQDGRFSDSAAYSQFLGVITSFQVAVDVLLTRLYEASFLDGAEYDLAHAMDDATFYRNLQRSKICMDYNFFQKYRAICNSLLKHLPDSEGWLTAIAEFEALNDSVYKTYSVSDGDEDSSQYVPLSILEVISTIESMIQAGKHYV